MTGEERDRRDSRALEPELITDPQAKAAAEARNGFRQYDAAIGAIPKCSGAGVIQTSTLAYLGFTARRAD
jgi:hypothetical protein